MPTSSMPASQGPSWARQGEPCRRSADGRFPEKAGTYRCSVPSGVGNPLRTGGRGSRSPGECGCHSLPHRKSRQWIPSIINAASGIRLASHHEYALMPLPQQDLYFLPDLVRIQCPADRLFIWIVGMRSTGTHWNRGWRCTEEQKGQSGFRRSLPSRIWPYETVRPVNPVSERP